ncbi:PAS domain-containing protein [Sorangium sp. So ce1014]|uniref:PAS domain-containing protein n=1 Tax=Sorangium sp. So ce1014 TaxID=3133326 RepID=UPI003F5D9B7A
MVKNGGLTLEEFGRSLVELTMTEDVIRRRAIALLSLARREERELKVLGKMSRLTVDFQAGDATVMRGVSGAFDVSIPQTLTVRVDTAGEAEAAEHRLGATIVLRITPRPCAPLGIYLDIAEPGAESVQFAESQAGSRDYLHARIEEEVRKELLRLVNARIAETGAERTVDLEEPLARALGLAGAEPGGREAPPPSRLRGAGAAPQEAAAAQQDAPTDELVAQLRIIGNAMPIQVWTSRPDGHLNFVNRAVLDYFDRTEEQVLGEGWLGVVHPDDVQKTVARWTRSLQTGEPYETEFRLWRTRDQTYREHVVSAQPQRDAAGNIVLWIGGTTDVADVRRAVAALRTSEARYRLFAEASNEGIWSWNIREDTTEWSDRMLELMGVSREAWGGTFMSFFERVHPDDRSAVQAALKAHLEERRPFEIEYRMRHEDGEYRDMFIRGMAEWDERGVPFQMAGGATDVTEQKRHQAMLKERLEIIEQQQEAIRALSTPIIEVWKGVLTMPVLGVLDEQRSQQMMEVLLDAVARTRCRHAIIDLTGVSALDAGTADHVLRLIDAVALLGAQGIVVGIRPEVAQTVVSLGLDLSNIKTLSNLREALLFAMQSSGVSVRRRRRRRAAREDADDAPSAREPLSARGR